MLFVASKLGDRDEIMAWLRERNSPLATTDPGPEALHGHEVDTHPPVPVASGVRHALAKSLNPTCTRNRITSDASQKAGAGISAMIGCAATQAARSDSDKLIKALSKGDSQHEFFLNYCHTEPMFQGIDTIGLL